MTDPVKAKTLDAVLRNLDYLIDDVVADAYVRGAEGLSTEVLPQAAKTLHDAIAVALTPPAAGEGPEPVIGRLFSHPETDGLFVAVGAEADALAGDAGDGMCVEVTDDLAAWEKYIADRPHLVERDAVLEQAAQIALAIDSGRGNEKAIARAIRALKRRSDGQL